MKLLQKVGHHVSWTPRFLKEHIHVGTKTAEQN